MIGLILAVSLGAFTPTQHQHAPDEVNKKFAAVHSKKHVASKHVAKSSPPPRPFGKK